MKDGKYFVIDAHCHIYPEKIAKKAAGAICTFYEAPNVRPHGDGTVDMLIQNGTAAGIDKFIVQSVATTPHQVGSINDFIFKTVKNSGDRLVGLGTLHPDSENQEHDVQNILDLGLHGVKLHPDIQGFKIDDYRCLKIYELCEAAGLPILMHTGDSRYDNSNPNRLLPILEIYTNLTVIGAHFGGWSMWEEASKKLAHIPNLYVDCSSSMPWLSNEKTVEIIRRYGADRVLFGTDYPMWSPNDELDRFMTLDLTDEERRLILSENAIKLFNLKP